MRLKLTLHADNGTGACPTCQGDWPTECTAASSTVDIATADLIGPSTLQSGRVGPIDDDTGVE
jgi:hypothetical protein